MSNTKIVEEIKSALETKDGVVVINKSNHDEVCDKVREILLTYDAKTPSIIRDYVFEVASDGEDNKGEWILTKTKHSDTFKFKCSCSRPIKHANIYINSKTNNMIVLGSNCRWIVRPKLTHKYNTRSMSKNKK